MMFMKLPGAHVCKFYATRSELRCTDSEAEAAPTRRSVRLRTQPQAAVAPRQPAPADEQVPSSSGDASARTAPAPVVVEVPADSAGRVGRRKKRRYYMTADRLIAEKGRQEAADETAAEPTAEAGPSVQAQPAGGAEAAAESREHAGRQTASAGRPAAAGTSAAGRDEADGHAAHGQGTTLWKSQRCMHVTAVASLFWLQLCVEKRAHRPTQPVHMLLQLLAACAARPSCASPCCEMRIRSWSGSWTPTPRVSCCERSAWTTSWWKRRQKQV